MRDRGLVWVVVQFALMAATLAAAWIPPRWPEGSRDLLRLVAAVLALSGGLLAVWAARTLGRSLSPFPVPGPRSTLVTGGPFRLVRHPIYTGGILFFGGYGLATSIPALAGAFLLAAWWTAKARVEEAALTDRFPDYERYRERVHGALLPRP